MSTSSSSRSCSRMARVASSRPTRLSTPDAAPPRRVLTTMPGPRGPGIVVAAPQGLRCGESSRYSLMKPEVSPISRRLSVGTGSTTAFVTSAANSGTL
ncbi:hypothetical protein ACFPRL_02405 [Pseudoclavibacter helvolus]